ncbi:hypothetical protein [Aquimarina sp. Aq107]|uniref:hypothetical protein n=1 Tax=Aquimarina sp. Aq107 TaxID=1191912 RepID=UPI000D561ABF|nr:hypothetical protein [Aquimarina sp. Aq107]
MKKIILLILCITSLGLNAQNEINKTVSVDGPGWKKVARLDGAYGRGYNEVTLLTTGGSSTPRVAKISWFKGWSAYGGLNLSSVSDNGYWSDARITYDSTKAYLEINFTSAIPVLKVYLDQSAWIGGDILEGILPVGSGTVLLTAKFGRLNYGENDLYLSYDGNLGIGKSNPTRKLDVNGSIASQEFLSVQKGGSYLVSLNGQEHGYITGRNSSFENKFLIASNGNTFFNGGNVGIGTTTPAYKLDVTSTVRVGDDNWGALIINGKAKNDWLFNAHNDGNTFGIRTQRDNGEASWSYQIMTFQRSTGNVGIGTTTPDAKLAVNGNIHTKEVKVDLIGWADYVFKEDYNLPTLQQVEDHISSKGHLINIPSAAEVAENGIQLGEMNAKLLEKIEELTLYTIAQEKKLKEQEKINNQLKTNNQNLEARLAKVETLLGKE